LLYIQLQLGIVAHICNLSTQEAEAGKSQVQGQPGINSKILSPKKKKKIEVTPLQYVSCHSSEVNNLSLWFLNVSSISSFPKEPSDLPILQQLNH
jgi:hypothetical protein